MTNSDTLPDDGGWRPWHGGICPVDPLTKVEYRLRNTAEPWSMAAEAGQLRWDHGRSPESAADPSLRRNDIVAYRIAPSPTPNQGPTPMTDEPLSKGHTVVERLAKALADRDKAANVCPVNRPSWKGGGKPCPLCAATARDTCHRLAGADHAFVNTARAAISRARGEA